MKVAIVGAGNGGSFTALHWGWYSKFAEKDIEVELIYNPEYQPERVGQATLLMHHIFCGQQQDLIGIIIRFMPHSRVVFYMKDGDRRTIISSIISQQIVWQCTIVHGRCKNLSWNLVTSK